MLGSSFLFALMGVCVKLASLQYGAGEIVMYRSLVGAVYGALLVNAGGLRRWKDQHHPDADLMLDSVLNRPRLVILAGDVGSRSRVAMVVDRNGVTSTSSDSVRLSAVRSLNRADTPGTSPRPGVFENVASRTFSDSAEEAVKELAY